MLFFLLVILQSPKPQPDPPPLELHAAVIVSVNAPAAAMAKDRLIRMKCPTCSIGSTVVFPVRLALRTGRVKDIVDHDFDVSFYIGSVDVARDAIDLAALIADTRRRGARWSISLRRGDDRESFAEYCSHDLVRTASVAKIFVLMELASRLADGVIDADQLLDRRRVDAVLDSGLWHAMRADSLPVADVAS